MSSAASAANNSITIHVCCAFKSFNFFDVVLKTSNITFGNLKKAISDEWKSGDKNGNSQYNLLVNQAPSQAEINKKYTEDIRFDQVYFTKLVDTHSVYLGGPNGLGFTPTKDNADIKLKDGDRVLINFFYNIGHKNTVTEVYSIYGPVMSVENLKTTTLSNKDKTLYTSMITTGLPYYRVVKGDGNCYFYAYFLKLIENALFNATDATNATNAINKYINKITEIKDNIANGIQTQPDKFEIIENTFPDNTSKSYYNYFFEETSSFLDFFISKIDNRSSPQQSSFILTVLLNHDENLAICINMCLRIMCVYYIIEKNIEITEDKVNQNNNQIYIIQVTDKSINNLLTNYNYNEEAHINDSYLDILFDLKNQNMTGIIAINNERSGVNYMCGSSSSDSNISYPYHTGLHYDMLYKKNFKIYENINAVNQNVAASGQQNVTASGKQNVTASGKNNYFEDALNGHEKKLTEAFNILYNNNNNALTTEQKKLLMTESVIDFVKHDNEKLGQLADIAIELNNMNTLYEILFNNSNINLDNLTDTNDIHNLGVLLLGKKKDNSIYKKTDITNIIDSNTSSYQGNSSNSNNSNSTNSNSTNSNSNNNSSTSNSNNNNASSSPGNSSTSNSSTNPPKLFYASFKIENGNITNVTTQITTQTKHFDPANFNETDTYHLSYQKDTDGFVLTGSVQFPKTILIPKKPTTNP